jgi:hypothetical protein
MKKRNILIWILNVIIVIATIGEVKAGWLTRLMGINCIGCHPGNPSPSEQKTEKPAAKPAPSEQKTE